MLQEIDLYCFANSDMEDKGFHCMIDKIKTPKFGLMEF